MKEKHLTYIERRIEIIKENITYLVNQNDGKILTYTNLDAQMKEWKDLIAIKRFIQNEAEVITNE